jgi:hypothetical protein
MPEYKINDAIHDRILVGIHQTKLQERSFQELDHQIDRRRRVTEYSSWIFSANFVEEKIIKPCRKSS